MRHFQNARFGAEPSYMLCVVHTQHIRSCVASCMMRAFANGSNTKYSHFRIGGLLHTVERRYPPVVAQGVGWLCFQGRESRRLLLSRGVRG